MSHLQNGDFDSKLDNWTCDGDVTPGYFARFGALNELRYSSNRASETTSLYLQAMPPKDRPSGKPSRG